MAQLALALALLLWTLLPIVMLSLHVARDGGSLTGADGIDPYDQFQYLAWIRDAGEHVLIANPFGMVGGRVFLQPLYLAAGFLWRVWGSLPASYLVWAPIDAFVMFAGYRAYARRRLPLRSGAQLLAMVLALFFSSPVSWFGFYGIRTGLSVGVDSTPALYLWHTFSAALAVGLFPLVLLGLERVLAEGSGRLVSASVLWISAGALLIGWLHSWQGIVLVLVVVGTVAVSRPQRRHLALVLPTGACIAPLAYQAMLSAIDPGWKVISHADRLFGIHYLVAFLVILGPLVLAAAVQRRRPADEGELMLVLWPAMVLVVFLLYPEFPTHALEGLTLPLAVLAVRAWPRDRRAVAVGATLLALFTLPGLAHLVKSFRDEERTTGPLYFESRAERAAMSYLAAAREGGGVLALYPLTLEIPALTDRSVWVGHGLWTPDYSARVRAEERFFSARLSARKAEGFVAATGVRWIVAGCHTPAFVFSELRPLVRSERWFGCLAVVGPLTRMARARH